MVKSCEHMLDTDLSNPVTGNANDAVLMSTSVDGVMYLWDRRDPTKIPRKLMPPERVPPWCLSACWSADGERIFCGRRNGTGNIQFFFGPSKENRTYIPYEQT